MEKKKRKSRLTPHEKRSRTYKKNHSPEERAEAARKAGLKSGTKFSSESSKKANDKRWAAHRAKKEAELKGEA